MAYTDIPDEEIAGNKPVLSATAIKLRDNVGGGYILLQDQKTLGTAGGGATANTWQTRDLTNEVSDTGSACTLSSNQFTLLAGTYRINASAPAYQVAVHRLRLKNVTDTTYPLYGLTAFSHGTSPSSQTHSALNGEFTIASSKAFSLEHFTQSTSASTGLGIGAGVGAGTEIYGQVELWKVA